jgi:hypothetical protein
VFGALLVMLASACNGSTAPEPGEHETKHEETTESLRLVSTAPTAARTVAAAANAARRQAASAVAADPIRSRKLSQ